MDFRPFVLLFLLLLHHAPPAYADATDSPSPSPTTAPSPTTDFDFIRERCNATLYPDVCYSSLSRFASSISHSPAALSRFALSVSLSEASLASSYFSNLSHSAAANTNARPSALHDCSSTFSTAASQIRSSFKQMCQLGSGRQQLRFQISNVQTWMSAALTNVETCADGFGSASSDSTLKSEVSDRVAIVRMLTSNALALVNNYASTVC